MIIGIGVDTVEHARVQRAIESARFARRVFAPAELELPLPSIAARFAAREAAVKALGGLHGMELRDLEVRRTPLRRPEFVCPPRMRAALDSIGVDALHLSLAHDRTHATAFVVAERRGSPTPEEPM